MKFEDCKIGMEIIDLETNCHGIIIGVDSDDIQFTTITVESEENSHRRNEYGELCPKIYHCSHNEVEPLKNNNK